MSKRRLFCLLLASIMLLTLSVFAGCGKKEEPKGTTVDVNTPSSQTEDKTEDKINKIIKHIADKEEIGLIKNKSS